MGIYRCLMAVDNVYDVGCVILNEVKDLAVSRAVNRHVDHEIFRFAQDDIVAACHSERSEESPRCVYTLYVGYIFVTRKWVQGCFRGSWLRETVNGRDERDIRDTREDAISCCPCFLSRPSRPFRLSDSGRLPRNCMESIGYQ